MKKITTFFQLIRVRHWIKNLFIFAPLIFALYLFDYSKLTRTIVAFISFSFISVLIYILNDIKDKKSDAMHDVKRLRPIASNLVKPYTALIIGIVFFIIGIILACYLGIKPLSIMLIYVVINILYSFIFKNFVIVDVFFISIGFCLRVLLGSIVINVVLSHWMLITTFTISLIIGFGKRRHELELLGKNAGHHRNNLNEYNKTFLDMLIIISTSITAIGYTLYTINTDIINKFGTAGLIFTIPFVYYGLFRYLLLIYCKGKGGSPEELVVTDPGIIIAVILWFIVILLQIYFKDLIQLNFNFIN